MFNVGFVEMERTLKAGPSDDVEVQKSESLRGLD